MDTKKPIGTTTVIRRLDSGEEVEQEGYYDDGNWWDATSRVKIPNVIGWYEPSYTKKIIDLYKNEH